MFGQLLDGEKRSSAAPARLIGIVFFSVVTWPEARYRKEVLLSAALQTRSPRHAAPPRVGRVRMYSSRSAEGFITFPGSDRGSSSHVTPVFANQSVPRLRGSVSAASIQRPCWLLHPRTLQIHRPKAPAVSAFPTYLHISSLDPGTPDILTLAFVFPCSSV
jgi:hypothetical protein